MGRAKWIGPASPKLRRAQPGCNPTPMILRPASAEDLPFILSLEQKFREMRLLGGNDLATHQRQLANPDCSYWIVETDAGPAGFVIFRSEEHTSELQSRVDLVCRLLL